MEKEKLSQLRDIFTRFDLDEESEVITDLNELRKKASENKVQKAILYLRCYNLVNQYSTVKEISEYIESVLKDKELFKMVEEYIAGEFGKFYLGSNIRNEVLDKEEKIDKFLGEFFMIFGGEENEG